MSQMCQQCGNMIEDNVNMCGACGALQTPATGSAECFAHNAPYGTVPTSQPPPPAPFYAVPPQPVYVAQKKINQTALIGFCLGTGSFFFNPFCALGIAALVMGISSIKKFDEKTEKCYWMGIAAIITGAMNIVIYLVSMILGIVGSLFLSPIIGVMMEELFHVIFAA